MSGPISTRSAISRSATGYNGLNAADVVTDWGLDRQGIEHAPPMVTRGVLLDVGFDGGAFLGPGRVVTPDDLARAEAAAGVVI